MTETCVITLNVGGIFYTTTTSTLQAGDGCNYFDTLLSGRFPILRDSKDNIFVDRDGSTFRYILNFLRGGALIVCEANPAEAALVYAQILEEARFYSIEILAVELASRIKAIEEHENKPTINVVVTELQRLQRQMQKQKKTPKKPLQQSGGLAIQPSPAPSPVQQQLFALNIPF